MIFGYYEKAGVVVGKIVADAGCDVPERAGCSFVQVADRAALNKVENTEAAKEAADQLKIAEALESMAIAEVKKTYIFQSGKYKDKT